MDGGEKEMSTDTEEKFEEILFKIMKLRDLAEADYSMLETLDSEMLELEDTEMSKERQIVVVQKTILKELKMDSVRVVLTQMRHCQK